MTLPPAGAEGLEQPGARGKPPVCSHGQGISLSLFFPFP